MSSIIAGITKDLKAVPENLKAKAKGADAKKLLLLNVPYILAGYFCDKVAWLWRVSEGADASAKMIAAMNGFDTLFSNPLPSFQGEPKLVEISDDMDAFTDMLWNSLNEDNKVSLFVRFIDIETGKYETRIINKNV